MIWSRWNKHRKVHLLQWLSTIYEIKFIIMVDEKTMMNTYLQWSSLSILKWQQMIDIIGNSIIWGEKKKTFRHEWECTLLVSSSIKYSICRNDRVFGTFIQGARKIPFWILVGECRLCEHWNGSLFIIFLANWPRWARVQIHVQIDLLKLALSDLCLEIVPLRK